MERRSEAELGEVQFFGCVDVNSLRELHSYLLHHWTKQKETTQIAMSLQQWKGRPWLHVWMRMNEWNPSLVSFTMGWENVCSHIFLGARQKRTIIIIISRRSERANMRFSPPSPAHFSLQFLHCKAGFFGPFSTLAWVKLRSGRAKVLFVQRKGVVRIANESLSRNGSALVFVLSCRGFLPLAIPGR